MEKDTRLINIYLKIHHKRSLTISDLSYLAQYDPECLQYSRDKADHVGGSGIITKE